MTEAEERPVPLARLVHVSDQVAATNKRSEKTGALAALLKDVPPARVGAAVAVMTGELTSGPLGVGPSRLSAAWPDSSADESTLTLAAVESALATVAAESGPGSVGRKIEGLRRLLLQGTRAEQSFLFRLCFGELRQGALSGVMVDAVAKAFGVPRKSVQRAYMLTGDLPKAAELACTGGKAALASVGLEIMRPVEPMLATPAEDPAEALERLGTAVADWKLDGARIQAHKVEGHVRIFTRNLRDVTGVVPDVAEVVRKLEAETVVLDGEAIAMRPDGRPHTFQTTMRRFGRGKLDAATVEKIPLSAFFFDCLFHDGETLVDRPLTARLDRLAALVPEGSRLPRITTDSAQALQDFLDEARAAGHEGVMAKDPSSTYEAGRRGKSWLKLKPANTLDLVVLAVERGSGRRSAWLSNIHLGARDPESGGYVMLGKTFKGMTDDVLRWQTETFPKHAVRQDRWVTYLEPRFVAEIAFNEIQRSPRYPAGLALRFARLKGYRDDKSPEQADTIETVRALFASMTGEAPP